jgi:YesN/AraC family two-component response regulator
METGEYQFLLNNGEFSYKHVITNKPNNNQHESYLNSNFQLFYLISGNVSYIVEGVSYPLNEGDLLLLNNKELHRPFFLGDKSYERILVFFSKEFFSHYTTSQYSLLKYFECKKPGSFNILNNQQIEKMGIMTYFERMEEVHKKNKPQASIEIELEAVRLLLRLNEIIDENALTVNIEYNYDEKIEEIIRYIHENFTKQITLADIEHRFFVNRYYFSHQFKKITGTTFKDYINRKRITKASELIKLEVKPMRASEMVGFEDYTNFYRSFKKIYGVSPSEYS